jgi:hypothetical protein
VKFADGKWAVGMCQRCGVKELLRKLVPDGQIPNLLVHPRCRDMKHEQERRQIREDAQILRRPSVDTDNMGAVTQTLVQKRGDTGPYFGGGT